MLMNNKITLLLLFFSLALYSKKMENQLISIEEFQEFLNELEEEKNNIIANNELPNESEEEKNNILTINELPEETRAIKSKKPWTLIVYMAADNDLHYFAWKNLKQMEIIGSNHNITIVVQINTPGTTTPTKRYVVEKGKKKLVQDFSISQKLNSGIPATLIDCVSWATNNFPATNYALILWDHGTGALDPKFKRLLNPFNILFLNHKHKDMPVQTDLAYTTLVTKELQNLTSHNAHRGICFDDSFKSYLTNQDLEYALAQINTTVLQGNKLSLIGFDACLMSMIEVACVCKKYAQFFVASQEIEYGTGWKYDDMLQPFLFGNLTPEAFASHIVHAYERTYIKLIDDYTMSALNLSYTQNLEDNINAVAAQLLLALQNQVNHNVDNIIRKCKSTQHCTCFDEPTYIDLGHFYKNLQVFLQNFQLKDKNQETALKNTLSTLLASGLQIIGTLVFENKVGKKLSQARGISIYFPEHILPQTYLNSPFAKSNQNWITFLQQYMMP